MSIIATTLESLKLGKPVVHENLAMFPLLGGNSGEPSYRTLREALDARTVEVTEVSEGGSVPRLALVNRGDKPILIVDGEELVGAKQNRILNITILAPAGKTTILPVSCVEQGRWNYRSRTFEDRDRLLFHKARAAKAGHVSECRRSSGSSDSNQGEVWGHIADKMCAMSVDSPSSAMEDIYTSHAPRVDAYVQAIRPVEGQAGAVFAVNGRVEGIEAFAYGATMSRFLPKLVRGYAIDAIEGHRGPVPALTLAKVKTLLRQAAEAPVDSFPAAGLGEDLRFRSSTISGGALAADGVLLHLCAFRLARQGSRTADDDGGTIRRRRGGQSDLLIE